MRKRIGWHADEAKTLHRNTKYPSSRRSSFAIEMSRCMFEQPEQLLISLVIQIETFEKLIIVVVLFDGTIDLIELMQGILIQLNISKVEVN